MTDMIDKIARAMHAGVNGHVTPPPTWDNQSEQSQNYWRISARAAIAAMRNCTPAMLDPGSDAHPADGYVRDTLLMDIIEAEWVASVMRRWGEK